MSDRTQRTGHGRWAITPTPHPGYLWCSDSGHIGFEHVDVADYDPTPVLNLITAFAGRPAAEAFQLVADVLAVHTVTGSLDTWTPDKPTRLRIPDMPRMGAAEVKQAMQ